MIIKNDKNPLFEKISNLLIIISSFWLLFNIAAVYLFFKGGKPHRIETAAYIFITAIIIKLILIWKNNKEEQNIPIWPNPQSSTKILLFLFSIVAWILLYFPYLNAPFLSDDYVFIVKYMDSAFVFDESGFFRPVFSSFFYILMKLFGTNPLPFHLFNLCFHLGSAIMIYRIAEKLSGSFFPAFSAGLIFFLNPVQAEAALWISGLQETLWTFFFLAALTIHLQKRDLTVRSTLFASFFVFISLLSKETAVCFLPFFIVLDLAVYKFKRGNKLKYAYIAYFLILVFYLLLRSNFSDIPAEHLPAISFLFIKKILSQPFKVFLFPWNRLFAGQMILLKFIISSAFVIITTIYFLKIKDHFRHLMAALAFIYFPLIPLSGMFYVASDLQGSRYLYLSSFGWGLLLSLVIFKLIGKKVISILFAIFLVIILSLCLKTNLKPWSMASDIIKILPANLKGTMVPDNIYGAYILRNGKAEYEVLKHQNSIPNKK